MKFYKSYYGFINENTNTQADTKVDAYLTKAKAKIAKKHYRDSVSQVAYAFNHIADLINNKSLHKDQARVLYDKVSAVLDDINKQTPSGELNQTRLHAIQAAHQEYINSLSVIKGLIGEIPKKEEATATTEQPTETTEKPTEATEKPTEATTTEQPATESTPSIKGLVQLDATQKTEALAIAKQITSAGTNVNSKTPEGKKQKENIQTLLNKLLGTSLVVDGQWGKKSEVAMKQLKNALDTMEVGDDKKLLLMRNLLKTDKAAQIKAGSKEAGHDGYMRLHTLQAIVLYLGGNHEQDIKQAAVTPVAKTGGTTKTGTGEVTASSGDKSGMNELVTKLVDNLTAENYTDTVKKQLVERVATPKELVYISNKIISLFGKNQNGYTKLSKLLLDLMDNDKHDVILKTANIHVYASAIYGACNGIGTQDDFLNAFFNYIEKNPKMYRNIATQFKWAFKKDMMSEIESESEGGEDWYKIFTKLNGTK
jgi:hypothetical protein